MSDTPLLLIHAGMRPGEIILARADGSEPVFLPPSKLVYRFMVGKNQAAEEWALLRHYADRQPPEALLSFPSQEQAEQALAELHKALLEAAPATTDETRKLNPAYVVGAGLLLVALLIIFTSKKDAVEVSAPTSTSSFNQTQDNTGASFPGDVNATFRSLEAPVEAQATPPTAPSVSPGDMLLQQIQQTGTVDNPANLNTGNESAQQPQAPAAQSPGDSLLNMIKKE